MISIQGLLYFVVYLIVVGLVLWLLDYLVTTVPMQEPYKRVARVVLVVLGVLILIFLLLSLIGYPVFRP